VSGRCSVYPPYCQRKRLCPLLGSLGKYQRRPLLAETGGHRSAGKRTLHQPAARCEL